MRPIIITTPFSGANHIAENLFNLMNQWYNCRSFIHSFLNVKLKEDIVYLNGTIYYNYQHDYRDKKWFSGLVVTDLHSKRIQYLLASPDHLLTVHQTNSTFNLDRLHYLITELNYFPIFIERKNRLHHILAHINFTQPQQTSRISYFPTIANSALGILEQYFILKKSINGVTIYYEDFVELGADENALIQLLNLDNKPFTPANIENRFFEFTEDNIVSTTKWREDRTEFLNKIAEIGCPKIPNPV